MPDVKTTLLKHLTDLASEYKEHSDAAIAAKENNDPIGQLTHTLHAANTLGAHAQAMAELYRAYDQDTPGLMRDLAAYGIMRRNGMS